MILRQADAENNEPDSDHSAAHQRPDLAQRVAERFRITKPFLDYVNRAIEYVQEE